MSESRNDTNTGSVTTARDGQRSAGQASERVATEELVTKAYILGQPDGPFGTAVASRNSLLMRSVGAARFSRFQTVELAASGFFIRVPNMGVQPYKTKSTLIEFELFLGESDIPDTAIVRGIGHIEEVRSSVDVPTPTPAGYVFKILQMRGDDVKRLEEYIHEKLLRTAM